jgi:hypothetical protein
MRVGLAYIKKNFFKFISTVAIVINSLLVLHLMNETNRIATVGLEVQKPRLSVDFIGSPGINLVPGTPCTTSDRIYWKYKELITLDITNSGGATSSINRVRWVHEPDGEPWMLDDERTEFYLAKFLYFPLNEKDLVQWFGMTIETMQANVWYEDILPSNILALPLAVEPGHTKRVILGVYVNGDFPKTTPLQYVHIENFFNDNDPSLLLEFSDGGYAIENIDEPKFNYVKVEPIPCTDEILN